MSEIKDDPREVLVLLNSLGFVGITATQLKAFMKDLKIYRKIKEREKQQRREEMKAKIINKQQALVKEAQGHLNTDYHSNNIAPSESSNSFDNESLVKLRIRCIPREKDMQYQKHFEETVIKLNEELTTTSHKKDVTQKSDRIYHQDHFKHPQSKSKQNMSKYLVKESHLTEKYNHNARLEEQVKPVVSIHKCPINETVSSDHMTKSRSKSAISEPIGNVRTQSALSARSSVNSAHKSFIRPWRLQPDAQKNVINKKCDPVALYQKYQQEWKQISFPGEAKHLKVRWAVREKMLGADPHPIA
ncbi:hydrolethalus syndrome protein 1 homolog isoform X2 [Odontomachus brunneus]|uniref:hydrolethalus syndrome protein 1 homolog isoform X2 n=1 Tax=Odontomachus brunneus TaxID=486640 RepID=UPI0013F2420F|nr:hydrolethalus syndrome protein 1 homolog isoform X2 [Odontomachus brunneus]